MNSHMTVQADDLSDLFFRPSAVEWFFSCVISPVTVRADDLCDPFVRPSAVEWFFSCVSFPASLCALRKLSAVV